MRSYRYKKVISQRYRTNSTILWHKKGDKPFIIKTLYIVNKFRINDSRGRMGTIMFEPEAFNAMFTIIKNAKPSRNEEYGFSSIFNNSVDLYLRTRIRLNEKDTLERTRDNYAEKYEN